MKKGILPKVTAVAWLTNIIECLEEFQRIGLMRYGDNEIRELKQILRYIKAAPAPKQREGS
jgi:hypothetical protein